MTDLTTFLLAQIAAEEERARAVLDRIAAEFDPVPSEVATVSTLLRRFNHPRAYAGDYYGDFARRILEALEPRDDPAATLRRCAAYRAIVAEHVAVDWGPGIAGEAVPLCRACNNQRHPCPTLRALASIYADHEDYDPAWRLG